jgi:hypothetical protein
VEDERARVVVRVVLADVVAHVAVLLRRPRGVELLELEPPVDHGLQEVERADGVGHHGLVRAVPRLAHVRLCSEVEDVRPVGSVADLPHEIVDRRAVGEIGEVDLELAPQVPDVVERSARRRPHEGVDVRAERDERVRQVRAHEPVGARDDDRPTAVDVGELAPQAVQVALGPDRFAAHRVEWCGP